MLLPIVFKWNNVNFKSIGSYNILCSSVINVKLNKKRN